MEIAQLIAQEFSAQLRAKGLGGALGRQELQHQIMEITEIIRDDEAALWSGKMTAENSALLCRAISQRRVKLADLKEQLAALADS